MLIGRRRNPNAGQCDVCGKQIQRADDGKFRCACPDKSWHWCKGIQGTQDEQDRFKRIGYEWDEGGFYFLPGLHPRVILCDDGRRRLDPERPGMPESLTDYLDQIEKGIASLPASFRPV